MGVPALAEVGNPAPLLSTLTTLFVLLVAGFAWFLARRRSARLARGVLAVAALLVAAAWLPPADVDSHDHVTGLLTGEASFLLAAPAVPPLVVEGGEGRVEPAGEGRVLVDLSCPARCTFRVGAPPRHGAEPWVVAGDDDGFLRVTLHGGPLQVKGVSSLCFRLPLALRAMASGEGCTTCSEIDFLTGAGADGETTLRGSRGPVC